MGLILAERRVYRTIFLLIGPFFTCLSSDILFHNRALIAKNIQQENK